ncbi:MAG: glycerophosphodiester phosphodiesterase [Deltaproteobacteria bacterium]|nr:glycerophosphodiester phosphodiesterase [Deltaproteobacteria bacterium]
MALIIAHRGARSLAPENTLAAARKALEVGADLWETDVVVTSDGELVLLHDDSLARTTNVKDRFPDRDPWHSTTFTLDEIRLLDAGSWFVKADPFGRIVAGEVTQEDLSAYRNEKIPTLREALRFTQDAAFCINLELKRLPPPMKNFPVVEQVLAMIDDTGIEHERVIVSSFNHEWLREVQASNPFLSIQALAGESETDSLDWGNLDFETYNVLSTLIDEKQVRALTEKGISVNLFTVNEEAEMLRFTQAGAAGLITDFPQRAVRLLR